MSRPVVRRVMAALAALVATALAVGVLPLASLTPADAAEPKTPPKRIVTGWLPYWATDSSVTAFLTNADLFTEISPFWHTLQWNSATQTVSVGSYPLDAGTPADVLARLRTAGVPVVPSITDGTPARRLAAVLADPAQRGALVDTIVATVTGAGYDGIDLDLEKFAFSDGSATWAATQPNWVAFVTALGTALHARGKLLTVAIPPPCDTKGVCGTTKGYWVYAMDQIAPSVDRIRIMAYDFSYDRPGPIGPDWWARAILKYAVTVVAPAKLQIGAPSYGRNWVRRDLADANGNGNTSEYLLIGDCPRSNAPTGSAEKQAYTSITRRTTPNTVDIPALLKARGNPAVQWDATAKERWFRYSLKTNWLGDDGTYHSCTAAREVWYPDAASALARAQLVDQFDIGGVAYWSVGAEDPAAWAKLRYFGRTLAPVPTQVQVTVPGTATYGRPVTVSAAVTAADQPVGGVVATLQWRAKGAANDAWQDLGTAKTADDGSVAFTAKPTGTGTWRVQVAGSAVRLAGDTGAVGTTGIRAAATSRLGRTSVPAGTPVRLYATVAPATPGQAVRIQLLRADGTWRTTAIAVVNATGQVALTLPSARSAGQWSYRVVSAATTTLLPGYTAPMVLTTTVPARRR